MQVRQQNPTPPFLEGKRLGFGWVLSILDFGLGILDRGRFVMGVYLPNPQAPGEEYFEYVRYCVCWFCAST
jgi:hypothetical protein